MQTSKELAPKLAPDRSGLAEALARTWSGEGPGPQKWDNPTRLGMNWYEDVGLANRRLQPLGHVSVEAALALSTAGRV